MENWLLRTLRQLKFSTLQFGHGGEPWRTRSKGFTKVKTNKLQFGHGGEPWRTARVASALYRSTSFNSATAVNRGERPTDCGTHTFPNRFNSATAVNRGERDWFDGQQHGTARFNSATAVNRGEPSRRSPGSARSSGFNSATAVNRGEPPWVRAGVRTSGWLQFGHGGEPWRTPTPRRRCGSPSSFNSATAVNRGELDDSQKVWFPAAVELQFGHGGEPWRTRGGVRGRAVRQLASIRPRR